MAKNTSIGLDFRKVASMPASGLVKGCIYFDDASHAIKIATSETAFTTYAGVTDASWNGTDNVLTITNHDGNKISIDFDTIATTTQLKNALNAVRGGIGFANDENEYKTWYADASYVKNSSTVKDAIEKLDAAVQVARANAGVTTFAGKTGAITLAPTNETNGAINLTISDGDTSVLSASMYGINTAAYETKEYFVGTSSDTSANDTIKGAKAFTSEVLGTDSDASTVATVYGVQNKAQAVKEELLGTSNDPSTADTIHGVQNKVEAVKTELFGNSATDSSTTKTIEGLVKKTDEMKTNAALHLYSGASGTNVATKVTADGQTYRLVQGTTDIATFEIEKDSFVREGEVVKFNTDQEAITATGDANAKAGHYIKLVIKTHDSTSVTSADSTLWIPAESLVDSYTADNGSTGSEHNVTIVVDNTANTIAATVATSDGVSQLNFTGTDVTLATIAGKEVKAKLDTLASVDANTAGGVQLSENNNVLSASLIDNAVTTAKIVNDNVTTAKLDSSVRTSLGKANTAIQTVSGQTAVSNSSYVAVSVEASTNDRAVTLSSHANVTVQDVSTSADSTAMGLAEASNVKTYVNTYVSEQLCWSAFSEPSNS